MTYSVLYNHLDFLIEKTFQTETDAGANIPWGTTPLYLINRAPIPVLILSEPDCTNSAFDTQEIKKVNYDSSFLVPFDHRIASARRGSFTSPTTTTSELTKEAEFAEENFMDFGLSLSQFKQVSDDLCTPGTEIHVYVMERIVREGLVKGPNAAWDQSFLWDMECPGYFRNLYEKFYENKIDNFDWLFEELNISLQPDTGTSRVYAKPSTVRVNQKMLMGENLQQTDLCGNILFPNKNLGLEVSQNLNYLPTPFSSKNSADVANCTYGQDYKMELTRAENFAIHEHEEKPFRCYCAKSFTFLDSWREHTVLIHKDNVEQNFKTEQKLVQVHKQIALQATLPVASGYFTKKQDVQLNNPDFEVQARISSPKTLSSYQYSNCGLESSVYQFDSFGLSLLPASKSIEVQLEELLGVSPADNFKSELVSFNDLANDSIFFTKENTRRGRENNCPATLSSENQLKGISGSDELDNCINILNQPTRPNEFTGNTFDFYLDLTKAPEKLDYPIDLFTRTAKKRQARHHLDGFKIRPSKRFC